MRLLRSYLRSLKRSGPAAFTRDPADASGEARIETVLHQAGSEGSAFSHAITAWLASSIASCVSCSLFNSLHAAFRELAASSRNASRVLLLSRRVKVAVFAKFISRSTRQ